MGSNYYGQLGDGTTTDRNTSVQIESGGVTKIAAGSLHSLYIKEDGSLWAMGRNYNGQLGDGTTTGRNTSVQVETSGVWMLMDIDGAIPSYEADIDQDTLTDAEEIQIGTDPNIANTALISFYTAREATARSEGNTSGIAHAQTNYSSYQLYNEAEKNASDDGNYSLGLSDGNASGVAHAQANLSQYDLFTSKEKAESDNLAKEEGKSEMLEKVEADFASDGLSLVTYLEEMKKAVPYTNQWFYQPEMGWMWTDAAVFPLVFYSSESEESTGWLYFSQLPDQPAPSFYDYAKEIWVTPAGSQN